MGKARPIFVGLSLRFNVLRVAARFASKVKVTNTCHVFTAYIDDDGYGRFWVEGCSRPAHRVAWVISGRKLTGGYDLHHTCRNRCCVNPKHLRLLSRTKHLIVEAAEKIPF